MPVVLTRDEVKAVLGVLGCDLGLTAALMYVAGLRLMERTRLRALDLELTRGASHPPARSRRRLGPRRAAGGACAQVPGRSVRPPPAMGLPAAARACAAPSLVCEAAYTDCDRRPPAVRHGSERASRCRFFRPSSDFGGSALHRKEQSVSGVIRRLHDPGSNQHR